MAYIEKRKTGAGKYIVRWYDRSGALQSRTIPTKEAALRLKLDVEIARANGRDWVDEAPRREPGLGDVIKAYQTDVARRRSPGTARTTGIQLDVILGFLRATHGTDNPPLSTLSKATLNAFYDSTAGLKTSTRYKYVRRLEAVWRWAANEDEYADRTPQPRHLDVDQGAAAATLAPTWAEMDGCALACLDAWQDRRGGRKAPNVELYRLAVVLRFTGLRVQQAMGLRWADLDLASATLTIRPELGKTKAEKVGRRVPVSKHFVTEVKGWGAREGWLVPCNRLVRVARERDIMRAWDRAGVRAEVWSGQSFHAFRKGFISELKRAGADDEAVEYLVGHSLGLRGVYTDPETLPLRAAVGLVPKLGTVRLLVATREG